MKVQGETQSESSRLRFERLTQLAKRHDHDRESVVAMFSDRSDGVLSVNRYPEDEQGTATNAVFMAEPATRSAYACRGTADRGTFITRSF